MRKKIFYFIFTFTFVFILLNSLSVTSLAWGSPQIVSKINSAFENIEKWILQISTPAAAVAVGSGVFMKKLVLEMKRKLELVKKL